MDSIDLEFAISIANGLNPIASSSPKEYKALTPLFSQHLLSGINSGFPLKAYCEAQFLKPTSYISGAMMSISGASTFHTFCRCANGPAYGYSPGLRPRLFIAAFTYRGMS